MMEQAVRSHTSSGRLVAAHKEYDARGGGIGEL